MTVSGLTMMMAPSRHLKWPARAPINQRSARAAARDLSLKDDELLAEQEVLGEEGHPPRREGASQGRQETKETDHLASLTTRSSVPSCSVAERSFCASQVDALGHTSFERITEPHYLAPGTMDRANARRVQKVLEPVVSLAAALGGEVASRFTSPPTENASPPTAR
jgi:hypothetical protein